MAQPPAQLSINEAVVAIEALIERRSDVTTHQVRPSGDKVDVIKIWAAVADEVDSGAWASAFEAEIRREVPGAAAFRLEVRAEAGIG